MTTPADRHTASTINDTQLDELYERIEQAEAAIEAVAEVLADHNGDDWSHHPATQAVGAAITLPRRLPASLAATQATEPETITRVIALHEQWVKAGPPPLGTSMSRWWDARLVELHAAIRPTTGTGCRCHNGDELCSGCHRCPDICNGCDGPEYQTTAQPKEQ